MDCAAINVEVQANNKKISELGGEEGTKVAQNVIVGVAGLVIPILWFGMDFQGAAPKEIAALQARQQYLATLAEQRCGAVVPLPVQTIPTPGVAPPASLSVTPVPVPAAAPAVVPVSAPAPIPGAAGSAPAAVEPMVVNCVKEDGSFIRVQATACPPPLMPLQP